jgi:uncharacterized protein YcfJ
MTTLKAMIGVLTLAAATHASAEITVYQGERFRGRAVTTAGQLRDLEGAPFGTRARSVVIYRGNWEVCDRPGFGGHCVLLQAGSYDSVDTMGLDHGIASARGVTRTSHYLVVPPPLALPTYEYRQRPRERIYEAQVLSVRAVVGPPEQRCWVEREQVVEREAPSGKGALAGAIIGGILGHQLSDGEGAGTVGGAAAGAAIGANVGRHTSVYEQDVQRCADLPPGPPDYWDVTYEFRGYRHRVQMSEPPGPTIAVNGDGEPRG